MASYVSLTELRDDLNEKLRRLDNATPCAKHGFKYLTACEACCDVECKHSDHRNLYTGCYCDYDSRGGYD